MNRDCEVFIEDDYGVGHNYHVVYRPSYQFSTDSQGALHADGLFIEVISVIENGKKLVLEQAEIEYIKEACREHYTDDNWEYAED